MSRPLIGLALGGGGARGWAHIGVLRALAKANIKPDILCGTSVGALVGGIHLAGKLDAIEDWARSLTKLRIVGYLDFHLSGGGMIGGNRLAAAMRHHLGGTAIEALPVPFTCVATDLVTGHEVWLNRGDLVEALRATIGLPGIFSPVEKDGRWLVDGALVNPLPVSLCRAMGAHVVIAVNLHADIIGETKLAGQNIPRAAGFDLLQEFPEVASKAEHGLGGWLKGVFGRAPGAPSLFGVMVQSLNIMQDRITRSRLAGEPPDVSISPRLGHIGLLEFDRAAEGIAEGVAATERALDEIGEAITVYSGEPA